MATLTGGSKKTAEFARHYGKPFLHLSAHSGADPASQLCVFVRSKGIKVLQRRWIAGIAGLLLSIGKNNNAQWTALCSTARPNSWTACGWVDAGAALYY